MKITAFLHLRCQLDTTVAPTLSLPDSSIMKNGNPFFIPDFDSSFSATVYTAVKVCRLGKTIAPRFASRYYTSFAPALNLRADNLLRALREAGLPWNAACGFDKSLVLGEFVETRSHEGKEIPSIIIGDEIINYHWPDEERIAEAINRASMYNALKMGDLILIPAEDIKEIPLKIGQNIRAEVAGTTLLKLPVR